MRARRIETVVQWVSDPKASAAWYGNIIGLIDNSKGGMPGQR